MTPRRRRSCIYWRIRGGARRAWFDGRDYSDVGGKLEDLSFDRQTVTFRPHEHRRLKTRTSWRVVPLFAQLAEILRLYVFGARLARGVVCCLHRS